VLREPFAALQAALLGVVGLILAFGLSLAVERYEGRRATVVDESNAIGTTYLRAQTLAEPMRTRSLNDLRRFADTSIRLADSIPQSGREKRAIAHSEQIERELWGLGGQSLARSPQDSAPRLYIESLNQMFDSQGTRVAALSNRVPTAVLILEIVGAAVALGLLSVYLAITGRGVLTVLLAAALVTMILLVTFDLDRPTRGLIKVPDTPLTSVRASMDEPPAAQGPAHP
jgi:Flp pilus assembly protein TadB